MPEETLSLMLDTEEVQFRPVSEIGTALCAANVLLVHLRDEPLFEITLPSKTQAYLAVGRPILMAVRGDAAELIEHAGAGIVCRPEDAVSIAAAVEKLMLLPGEELDAMGKNGKRFYQQELSLQTGVRHFEKRFKTITEIL